MFSEYIDVTGVFFLPKLYKNFSLLNLLTFLGNSHFLLMIHDS